MKKRIIILAIIFILALAGIGVYIDSAMPISKQIKDIAEKNALEDVSVRLREALKEKDYKYLENLAELENARTTYVFRATIITMI